MCPINIPQNATDRRHWIKYQLGMAGSGFAALARELGISRSVPYKALLHPYPRMERAIATKIGVSPEHIWPERYDADGKPNRPMGRPYPRCQISRLVNYLTAPPGSGQTSTNALNGLIDRMQARGMVLSVTDVVPYTTGLRPVLNRYPTYTGPRAVDHQFQSYKHIGSGGVAITPDQSLGFATDTPIEGVPVPALGVNYYFHLAAINRIADSGYAYSGGTALQNNVGAMSRKPGYPPASYNPLVLS